MLAGIPRRKDAHIDLLKHSSSSRQKVEVEAEADQRKSFQQKPPIWDVRTNGDGDIRMWAGYVNRLHIIFRVRL